jgi:hypothetical protein
LSSGLELYDSRVSQIELLDGVAAIYFSHAYIHKSKGTPGRSGGTGWSQAARLILSDVKDQQSLQLSLPSTIAEGYLEVGGIRHEIIPLPFKRKVGAKLYLSFSEGGELELVGSRPYIELLGAPIFLEDYP